MVVTHAPVVYEAFSMISKNAKEGVKTRKFPNYCGSFEILITGQEDIYVKKGINSDYTRPKSRWEEKEQDEMIKT